ncbi:MAG TPA: glycosyltransferase [bacterium]|nr:glycosyltransferase [bacterium]
MGIKVSVVIPVKEINDYIRESMFYMEKIDFDKSRLEVIVLPDIKGTVEGEYSFDIRIIETGPVTPGDKRDTGIKEAKGEIVAFIDDDVFPSKMWLKRAVELFEADENTAAAAGPAVTPENDSFMRKVSGYIYSSFLGGGAYSYRYFPEKARPVDDYPSCNLIIRKSVLEKIGGFNTEFWPGEDTVICLKITRDLKMKIIYDPDVLVYHHRRDFPKGHLKQVKSYAEHRGYFVKRFPETSLRHSYFMPSFFVFYILSFVYPVLFNPGILVIWSIPFLLYVLVLAGDSVRGKKIKYAFFTAAGIFITHLYYGVYFIKGLMAPRLKEEVKRK